MYKLKINLTLLCLFVIISLQSQDNLSYGIKAGLGLSTFMGNEEMNAQGEDLEKGGYITRFHIGAILNIDFIEDKFGIAPEILYAQKGGRYRYDGPGKLTLNAINNGGSITLDGRREDAISRTNSYLTIPVLLYYKPVDRIKLSFGINTGLLVTSTGSGESKFTLTGVVGEGEIITELDYNYLRDKPGEAKSEALTTIILNGTTYERPESIGAYFDNETDEGNFFKTFEFGLAADVTVLVTDGISLGLRANYGLTDVTNNKLDVSKQNPTVSRADVDRNLSFWVSLGFNF